MPLCTARSRCGNGRNDVGFVPDTRSSPDELCIPIEVCQLCSSERELKLNFGYALRTRLPYTAYTARSLYADIVGSYLVA